MKLGNFNGGYKILDFVKAVAYATGSASTETISGLYNRVKEALLAKSKPLVLHDLIIDVSGTQTLIGDTFIDRANASVDASKAIFYIGVGSNNVKITVTSAGALNADVYEYAGGAGGVSDLDDLSDVDLDNPTNGQVLKYNSETSKWENANESGGGGEEFQIIDPESETIWDDCEALDLSKPVYIKRGNYCVPALQSNHSGAYPYFFTFIQTKTLYEMSVTNGTPATVSITESTKLMDIEHTFKGGLVSASATIATGENSGAVTLTGRFGSISSINDLVGSAMIVEGSFASGEIRQFPVKVSFTDVDNGLTAELVNFEVPMSYEGSGLLSISDAEIYVKGTSGALYRLVPNKTHFDLNAGTPETVSFTVYREVTEDVYSTSEVLTNKKWIDGKPVYRKVVSLGSLPNSTNKEVDTGLDYTTTDLVMLGFCGGTNGVSYTPIPFTDPASSAKGVGTWIYKSAVDSKIYVKMTTDADWSTYDGYAIVYFTKATV